MTTHRFELALRRFPFLSSRVPRSLRRLWRFVLWLSGIGVLAGCSSNKLVLRDWQELPETHYAVPPYAAYLAPFKIALDPGHGGLSHLPGYKRGPTGKEEAVMNLNVARFLKEFLELAGAKVVMTRQEDRFVSLQARADIAAGAGCDFLISLHHNAAANAAANYAAVFYHLHPDYSPMSMDLARHIYFGIVEALRLPQLSPEGLLSDKLIYPAGFGLLRVSRLPAILLESSFYSNPAEEKRLMKSEYNRREAYGIFMGLARWAAGGIPAAHMIKPAGVSREKIPEIVYALSDGVAQRAGRSNSPLLIYSSAVSMRLDGEPVPVKLDLAQKRLLYRPDSALTNGPHLVQIGMENLFKNHNLPRTDTVIVAAPAASIQFTVPSLRLPGDGTALMPFEMILRDAEGEAVWEGTRITISADRGKAGWEAAPLQQGRAAAYFQAPAETGLARLVAEADGRRDTLLLTLVPPGEMRVLSGIVSRDSSAARLAGAQIFIDETLAATAAEGGSFFIPDLAAGEHTLEIRARGYAPERRTILMQADQSQIVNARLRPLLGGVLHDQLIILDAAGGGVDSGDFFAEATNAAQANLNLARLLADSLRWAGAAPVLVRNHDSTLALPARIELVNKVPRGWYLKLGFRRWNSDSLLVQCTNYPGNQSGQRLAQALQTAFAKWPATRTSLQQNTAVPEVTLTNKMAVEVLIYCREPAIRARDLPALFEGMVRFRQEELRQAAREDLTAQ